MREFITESPEETEAVGRELIRDFGPDQLFCLIGPLAAGKTTLVKGMARELEIEKTIVSPSYVLLREYGGSSDLFHLDLFRINSGAEFIEAGLEDYLLKDSGTVVIEWAGRIEEILPEGRVDVRFELAGEKRRKITVLPQLD